MSQSFAAISLAGEDRVWVDAGGGIHSLKQSHAGTFQEIHQVSCGRAISSEGWSWMRTCCGSEPDSDSGMNPGWQFVEYAKHELGWARVTINVWARSTEIALEFDDDAITESALRSVIALMRYVERNAPMPAIVTDDFGHAGQEISQVLREYRVLLSAVRHGEHCRRAGLAEAPERAPAAAWPSLMPTRH